MHMKIWNRNGLKHLLLFQNTSSMKMGIRKRKKWAYFLNLVHQLLWLIHRPFCISMKWVYGRGYNLHIKIYEKYVIDLSRYSSDFLETSMKWFAQIDSNNLAISYNGSLGDANIDVSLKFEGLYCISDAISYPRIFVHELERLQFKFSFYLEIQKSFEVRFCIFILQNVWEML